MVFVNDPVYGVFAHGSASTAQWAPPSLVRNQLAPSPLPVPMSTAARSGPRTVRPSMIAAPGGWAGVFAGRPPPAATATTPLPAIHAVLPASPPKVPLPVPPLVPKLQLCQVCPPSEEPAT